MSVEHHQSLIMTIVIGEIETASDHCVTHSNVNRSSDNVGSGNLQFPLSSNERAV